MVKISRKSSESKKKAIQIARSLLEKKAKEVILLDVRDSSGLCDYFIICSADSAVQVKAIHQEIVKICKKNNINIQHSEKDEFSRWILVDFFDIILHIFLDEAREYYNLEYLWSSAKRIEIKK